MPTVSIVMSVYNAEDFLHKAICSVLEQSYRDFEFIIINDGSTDRSEEIIASYTDKRIKTKNLINHGLSYCLNYAINISSGKYIARMDADDISEHLRIEKQFSYLESHNKSILVGCNCWPN